MSAFRLYLPSECTGKDSYPPAWHETLKHAVREQAGHRCVRCLHPYEKGEGEWSRCDERCVHRGPYRIHYRRTGAVEVIDTDGCALASFAMQDASLVKRVEARYRILTVHHLDGVKGNCRWWNLAALCQRCHLQIQGKVRMERVWPWEHSQWFKPYVAGYYAHVYLGEDLTREATEARLGELLALELQTPGAAA